MKLTMDESCLPYFEALASGTRLEIIQLLAEQDRNIKELADLLDISSSIVTKHVRKLEQARLITTRNISKDGNRQKMCTLLRMVTEIHPPDAGLGMGGEAPFYEILLPVGTFTGLDTGTPCGIATENRVIGSVNQPAHLFAPERYEAQMLWLAGGAVEYVVPNYLTGHYRLTAMEISGELGGLPMDDASPSIVTFSINGDPACSFFVLGETGPGQWPFDRRGILTVIRLEEEGVFVNGEKKSALPLSRIDRDCDHWTLAFSVDAADDESQGLSIFGEKLGNNRQDLRFRVFYELN